MSNILLNAPVIFSAEPDKGQGLISLIRKVQAQMKNSDSNLNPAQKSFTSTPALLIAKNLGLLQQKTIIRPEDRLSAGKTGISLKRGNNQVEFFDYQTCLGAKPVTTKKETKQDSFSVVIDAGHGGHDPGAIYPPGLKAGDPRIQAKEEDITLEVAKKLEAKLRDKNITVMMTRKDDTYVSLSDRTKFSNKMNPDLFLSIHANSGPESACGYEVYTQNPESYRADKKAFQKARLAKSTVAQEYLDKFLAKVSENSNRSDTTLSANLHVLRENGSPAVLVELGFISNPVDRVNLSNEHYQNLMANQLAEAIDSFARLEKSSD